MHQCSSKILFDRVISKLQQNGVWQLSYAAKSVLRYHISRLPKRDVSEMEERYPECAADMRAFLAKFFARHYSQIQNSLIAYMISEEFICTIRSGKIRILDIGSGPGIAYIAIADLLSCILQSMYEISKWPYILPVRFDYILNDNSGYCLGTAHQMIHNYSRLLGLHQQWVSTGRIVSI